MQLTRAADLSGKPAGFQKWRLPVLWGFATGILLSLLSLLLYRVVMPANYRAFLFISFLIDVLPLIPVLFYIGAALHQRAAAGGNLTFRESFSAVFVVMLIALAMLMAWKMIYALVIDPALVQRMKNYDVAFMRSMHQSDSDIQEKIKYWDERRQPGISVGNILSTYAGSLATNAAFGLLAAAIARRRPR